MTLLSPRQREILGLVAAGRTSKEIASELGISERTVNWHIAKAFGRLGASSRAEAVAITMRDDANGDAGNGEARHAEARRWRPSVLSLALALALTLLLGMIGGALIAGWDRSVAPTTPPGRSSTPSPGSVPAPRDAAEPATSPPVDVGPRTSVSAAPRPASSPAVPVTPYVVPRPPATLPAMPAADAERLLSTAVPTVPALPSLLPAIRSVP